MSLTPMAVAVTDAGRLRYFVQTLVPVEVVTMQGIAVCP